MEKFREAATNVGSAIDKLYSNIDKSISAVQKAQDAVLKAASSLDAVMASAKDVAGDLEQPMSQAALYLMSKITDIAEKELGGIIEGGQHSLEGMKDRIGSTPVRNLIAQKPSDSIGNKPNISGPIAPDLSQGAQSQITSSWEREMAQSGENLEEFYRRKLREEATNVRPTNNLSFDSLKESSVFGMKYESDMMEGLQMRQAGPIQVKQVREKLRASVDDDFMEEMENLQESGPLNFSNLRSLGGSDGMGMGLNMSTLNSGGGHIVN